MNINLDKSGISHCHCSVSEYGPCASRVKALPWSALAYMYLGLGPCHIGRLVCNKVLGERGCPTPSILLSDFVLCFVVLNVRPHAVHAGLVF